VKLPDTDVVLLGAWGLVTLFHLAHVVRRLQSERSMSERVVSAVAIASLLATGYVIYRGFVLSTRLNRLIESANGGSLCREPPRRSDASRN
jgi:hypothetical protein